MAPRSKPASAESTERLGRVDWVEAALQALAEEGISNVRVEVLAKRLNVTKGSFYWHFVDRNDLLSEMLDAWRVNLTTSIADRVKRKTSDPKARLTYLLKLSLSDRDDVPGGRIEQALREWAKSSDQARLALSRVDRERLDILRELYADLGLRPRAAQARAHLFLAYVIGANVVARDLVGLDLAEVREECRPVILSAG
jgi:AcrR family transcriptional regulator